MILKRSSSSFKALGIFNQMCSESVFLFTSTIIFFISCFFLAAGGGPRRGGPPNRNKAAGSNARTNKPTPTAEELDAELDAYVNDMKI